MLNLNITVAGKKVRAEVRYLLLVFVLFGLSTAFAISDPQANFQSTTHVYYIAADEVMWNYAPHGRNLVGVPESEVETSSRPPLFRKAIYREYTDSSFTTMKSRTSEWEHLGIMGPLIRAEVGDTIKVVFKNNTKIFCSMHPHGLAYAKDSEGAVYADGEQSKGNAVPPGESYTYIWTVPERSGPAPGDPSSILWLYHSHFIEPEDLNAGLIGPIIITRKGAAKADGVPKDVDREFVIGFAIFDETESRYTAANTASDRKYFPAAKYSDPVFRERFTFYSINGFVEGNLPMVTMKKGEHVRWYLFANGNEDDVHTPHWHGQTVVFNMMRTDMVHLEPMMMVVADMVPDNVGVWLFHCHVNEHMEGGMESLFTVLPANNGIKP